MRTLISGASGLIGTALQSELKRQGHDVYQLTRGTPRTSFEFEWAPDAGRLPVDKLPPLDAAIHLSGYNIAKKRWTPAVKELILRSRIDSTKLLCTTLASLKTPPTVMVLASAIGYYGNRGDEILTEDSPPGQGEFLPDVCMRWESSTESAKAAGIRVVNARIGPVLSLEGGVLAEMLRIFRLGLGGSVGNGRQWFSWISQPDVARALVFAMETTSLLGPLNLVSPNPVRNKTFTRELGEVLRRPTFFRVPTTLLKLLMGEMAAELPLSSTRVDCRKLIEAGFDFRHRELRQTLDEWLTE